MTTAILHGVGYILFAYIGLLIWLAEARGVTWQQRMKYFLGNFTWRFWALFIIAIFCLSFN